MTAMISEGALRYLKQECFLVRLVAVDDDYGKCAHRPVVGPLHEGRIIIQLLW